MKEVYKDTINYLRYYGEMNNEKIECISYFLEKELKDYNQLQSNWNSLREYLENEKIHMEGYFDTVLDKMNELESGDNK